MVSENKIQKLIESSKEVFEDCSTTHGGILAADVFNSIYPKDVKWYGYVWLRDGSYICMAADILEMPDISQSFFEWADKRLERIDGHILAHKYHPNGLVAGDVQPITMEPKDVKDEGLKRAFKAQLKIAPAYAHYQPDQPASLLIALKKHIEKYGNAEYYSSLAEDLANSISEFWSGDYFTLPTIDPWEEFGAYPDQKDVITYSLAMCSKGLKCASNIVENPASEWERKAEEMKDVVFSMYDYDLDAFAPAGSKSKVSGSVSKSKRDPAQPDKDLGRFDSSLLGLLWPAEAPSKGGEKLVNTVDKIIENNVENYGVYRYRGDQYAGRQKYLELELPGAGYWPVLNFWMSKVLNKMGRSQEAKKYYEKVISSVDKYIPEQIFEDGDRNSIKPLAWSHAMFLIASKELGYLEDYD